ncbi:MAG: hypothetical protein ACKO8X_10490, partial [Verrucomicrobiota bacterium]
MTRLAPCLLACLVVGCAETRPEPAVSPEALRQRAAALRAAGKTEESARLYVQAIGTQRTDTRDGRAAAADLRRELASLRISADDLAG